jgi:hypothetical protein
VTLSASFHADRDTWVHLHDYGTRRAPILALDNPDSNMTISVFDSVPLADHLAFARKLADATAAYLTALETYAAHCGHRQVPRKEVL